MDTLTNLAIKYKTDKWGKHHYTPIYYELFKNKTKRRKIKKVLEIGVAEGAGLKMFRDFFQNAIIYGAEIDLKRVKALQQLDRIKVYQCDQTSGNDLKKLFCVIGLDIDLIIDDGSHKPQDQCYTCLSVLPFMKKGCIYIIEDVTDDGFISEIKKFYSNVEIKKVGSRYDDQLIIIKT